MTNVKLRCYTTMHTCTTYLVSVMINLPLLWTSSLAASDRDFQSSSFDESWFWNINDKCNVAILHYNAYLYNLPCFCDDQSAATLNLVFGGFGSRSSSFDESWFWNINDKCNVAILHYNTYLYNLPYFRDDQSAATLNLVFGSFEYKTNELHI